MIKRYTKSPIGEDWLDHKKYKYWVDSCCAVLYGQWQEGEIGDKIYYTLLKNPDFDLARVEELDKKFKQDAQALIESVKEYMRAQGLCEEIIAHFGNRITSYDMEDPALVRLILDSVRTITLELENLIGVFRNRAREHKTTQCLAITHGQPAGIIYLGIRFCSYINALERDLKRISQAIALLSVGKFSGAFGIYDELDPVIEELGCAFLGLETPEINSQIIHRDRHAGVMSALIILACNLEHIAHNLWQMCQFPRNEAREYFDPFNQRGSTAMPHKKNPWQLERIRGMAGIMRGYIVPALENIRTWDERSMDGSSVERVIWPDATTLVHFMLISLREIFSKMEFFPEIMQENIDRLNGVYAAQYIKNELREQGIANLLFDRGEAYTFESTYDWVKWCALTSWDYKQNKSIKPFIKVLSEQGIFSVLNNHIVKRCFDPAYILRNTETIYERFGLGECTCLHG